jgi:MFS family permease
MNLQAPLSRLERDAGHLLFFVSLLSLLIFGSLMSRSQTGPTPCLPRVSQQELEFSADPAEADKLIKSWGDEGIKQARQQIWWDFGFLLSYAPLLSLGCTFAANGPFRHSRKTRTVGLLLAWGSLVAAATDVGANVAMLAMLEQTTVSRSALLMAKAFASVEFALLGMALAYILGGVLISLLDPPRPSDV